jgi:membrane protease YdiL (CAAX protease family)
VLAFAAAAGFSGPRLRGLDWRCGWRGALAGVAVFALWWGVTRLTGGRLAVPGPLGPLPAQGSGLALWGWGILGVVATPVAQELALRGFLLRRLKSVDFELQDPAQAGLWPWLASSAVSGFLQGPQWLPGSLAALGFGWLFMRTRRLGEALGAHVVLNALISVYVGGGLRAVAA